MAVAKATAALVERIYDAVLDERLWPGVFERVGAEIGGGRFFFFCLADERSSLAAWHSTLGESRDFRRRWLEAYTGTPWMRAGAAAPVGQPFRMSERVPLSVLRCTDFYEEVVRPLDFPWTCGGSLCCDDDVYAAFSVYRSEREGDFDPGAAGRARPYMPHLAKAVRLQARLQRLNRVRTALEEALDLLPRAVLIVDGRARVLWANRAAESLLSAADGIGARDDVLVAATASATARLRRLVRSGARRGAEPTRAPGGPLALPRPSGRRPLLAVVSPIPRGFPVAPDRATAILFVTDPEARVVLHVPQLPRAWDLTPAEARLAAILATGASLNDAAERLGVTRETVRTHLAHVFRKTETRRQPELIRLLLTSLPRLAAERAA